MKTLILLAVVLAQSPTDEFGGRFRYGARDPKSTLYVAISIAELNALSRGADLFPGEDTMGTPFKLALEKKMIVVYWFSDRDEPTFLLRADLWRAHSIKIKAVHGRHLPAQIVPLERQLHGHVLPFAIPTKLPERKIK